MDVWYYDYSGGMDLLLLGLTVFGGIGIIMVVGWLLELNQKHWEKKNRGR